MRNLKLAFRTLFKTPFVTAVAILSLALGIGANTAIFSLFEQMLLRPLPVPAPERLVNLGAPGPKAGMTSCGQAGSCEVIFSYPMFRDLERAQTVFTGLAAHRSEDANLAFRRQTENGEMTFVSGSYFPVLGVQPALGRLLGPSDDETIGGHPVAVLSYRFWETRLGADPAVLDQTIVVNGQPVTIIGVAPRGFDGTTLGTQPMVFVPISMRSVLSAGFNHLDNRRAYWIYLFGRLKPGVSMEQARTALNAIYRPIINDVEAPLNEGMSPQMMAQFRAREIVLEDGRRGQSDVHTEARVPLLLLFAITGIVLLSTCANIANLLLARGASRSMEMAVRLSLGASRRHVLAQLLTESCVLAVLGGIASLLVAQWTLAGIAAVLPPEASTMLQLNIRPSVVLFAAVISLGTGLVFGMFPALHSTRPDLVNTIRSNAGQIVGARSANRFRNVLVTSQIALSMMLLISAGLFLRSLMNISRVDLGVKIDQVVTFAISPELNGYAPERSQRLFERVEEELATLPGVTGVSAARVPLLAGSDWGNDVSVEGFPNTPDTDDNSRFNAVGPNYFSTVGTPILAGREFTPADRAGAPKVAIVNEAFAKKFNLGRDAVGKRMGLGDGEMDMQIVGVSQNAKYSDVKDEVPPLFFTPYRQSDDVGALAFYVRTAGNPRQLVRSIPGVMARLDPDLPVEELKTMPQQVRENVFMDRMVSTLSAAFAVLATLLAAVGLYGVLAYTVTMRTREIGVRIALGAAGSHVRGLVLRQVGWMMLVGGAIGILAALGLGRAASSLLFGLEGNDPIVVASAAIVLALVGFSAGLIPARRAARVDPMQALRAE